MRVSSVQSDVLTGKSFQIGSKGAANEEAEGEKLLKDKCGLYILQRLTHLRPKEHGQATVATNKYYCDESTPSCPVRRSDSHIITEDISYSPRRKILQLQNVSTKADEHKRG